MSTDASQDRRSKRAGRGLARWPGIVLVAAAVVYLAVEAVVAAAWKVRQYSYIDDYVNFLGSPFDDEFRGYVISSPLWFLMTAAWIVCGVLIAVAGVRLGRDLAGRRKRLVVGFSVLQAIALTLFAVFPLGQHTIDSGFLGLYLAGAFLSIIAGNALAITTGLSWRQLGLPRPIGITSVALGVLGLVNIPATYGWVPTGVAERISLYSFLGWALLVGITKAVRPRTP
jgi:hypothetical membrane protein